MKKKERRKSLAKSPTGISGLDEITGGGLPKGRATLICGAAGCGKTLLGMEFLVRGAVTHGEPGVFVSFEETGKELAANVASLGFDLNSLLKQKKILLEKIAIEWAEVGEDGDYNLERLFVRIHRAIESIAAKRVVLDSLEFLFSGLPNPMSLRSELHQLLTWLKRKGVTTVITAERGDRELTRHGLEEYVSDCVILLDHRVQNHSSVRRLRIVKYRGSTHGTNEYPFLIGKSGFSVLPVTSLGLNYSSLNKRISTGISGLDEMLSGKGFFSGSTILVSGTAGTGKTSMAAQFVDAACRRKEHVLFFSFEESPSQLMRNMRSIGINLNPWTENGLLLFHATRPTFYGLESHLATILELVAKHKPDIVVLDPVNALVSGGNEIDVNRMLLRLIDSLKMDHITAFLTNLSSMSGQQEMTATNISSLIDTWILLRDIEAGAERNRSLCILKSRGMAHSNQIREFKLTQNGVYLLDVYVGAHDVFTGSARLSQEAEDNAEMQLRKQETTRRRVALEHKRKSMEAQIAQLRLDYEAEALEALNIVEFENAVDAEVIRDRKRMRRSRKGGVREKRTIRRK